MFNLDPTKRGFWWPNARACAELSAQAYTGQTLFNHDTSTAVLIVHQNDCLFIAFRGTEDPKDFVQDAKFDFTDPIPQPDGSTAKIHKGFDECWESVREDVTDIVRSATQPTVNKAVLPQIFITGHSLGGALAILCAAEFARVGLPVHSVYTFGQPRVGNRAFRNLYNGDLFEETFRVVNQNDIVPRLPGWLTGYRHCGQEIFLPIGGGWDLNPSLWMKLITDALGLWGAYRHGKDVLVEEHFIAAYQTRIQLMDDTGKGTPS